MPKIKYSMEIKKIKVVERTNDKNIYVPTIQIYCPGCDQENLFELNMVNYCDYLHCPYCHFRYDVEEIKKLLKL